MSAKKRKAVTPWSTCNVCKAIFLTSDSGIHQESSCPPKRQDWIHPFVKGNELYTSVKTFQTQDSTLKFVPNEGRGDLILMSHQALQLSYISIGQPVVVSNGSCVPFIKIAWAANSLNEKVLSLLGAALTKEACDLNSVENDSHIIISKYNRRTSIAQEVTIECESTIEESTVIKLLPLVHESNIKKLYCVGNKFLFKNYGKNFVFKIVNIKPMTDSKTVLEQLDELDVNEKFSLIALETKWKIETIGKEGTNSEDPLAEIGGLNEVIIELKDAVSIALSSQTALPGLNIPRGILLYGPGGTGKTMLIEAIAQHFECNVIKIECSKIFSKYLGETEQALRSHFDKAKERSPSVILIDELDTMCPKASMRSEQERRIVATLTMLMDKLHSKDKSSVVVLATTSRINHIDKSLRRCGRFDKEIEIQVPSPQQRFEILKVALHDINHNLVDSDIKEISDSSHGFVGADLVSLVSKACYNNFKTANENSPVSLSDFNWALSKITPSAMREILIEVPNVRWSDIGGQDELKLKLKQAVEWPLKHGESFRRLGILPPRGLLMFGPPGCSKTMIAKALATESKLNFISVKGPELFSKWVGESEKAVREVFRRARLAAPSIVFFDELDALGGERSSVSGGSNVQERVLAQLLVELDGVEPLGNVSVIGATNRPDRIDPALLRPGRLDRIVYVPLPDKKTRQEIFSIQLKKTPVSADVDVAMLVEKTEGYSGAEVIASCHEAALMALEEDLEASFVSMKHFLNALIVVTPRTSQYLMNIYEKYLSK